MVDISDNFVVTATAHTITLVDRATNRKLFIKETKETKETGKETTITAIKLDQSERFYAVGLANGEIQLYNVMTGDRVITFNEHSDSVKVIGFSNCGKYL